MFRELNLYLDAQEALEIAKEMRDAYLYGEG